MAIFHNDLSDPAKFLQLLGSFYLRLFDEKQQLVNLYDALGIIKQQVAIDFAELQQITSRQLIPEYHFKNITPVKLFRSKFLDGKQVPLKYGVPVNQRLAVYGRQDDSELVYRYGVPLVAPGTGLDARIVRVQRITDSPVDATAYLFDKYDYRIEDNHLVFYENPFFSEKFQVTRIRDENGMETDAEITLWLRGTLFDLKDMGKTYGEPVGLYGETGYAYRDLINGYWDALTQCPSRTNIHKYIGAVVDAPVCLEEDQVVAAGSHSDRQWLATTKRVYFTTLAARFTADVGQTVAPGQFLTDAVIPLVSDSAGSRDTGINRFDPSEYPYLTLPSSYCDAGFASELRFPNDWVAVASDDTTQPPRLTFALGPTPEVISHFWDLYYQTMDGLGEDGAGLIQRFVTPDGRVNPAEFALKAILRCNYSLYKLNGKSFGHQRQSLELLAKIREIMPPGHSFLFDYEAAGSNSDVAENHRYLFLGGDTVDRPVATSSEIYTLGIRHPDPESGATYRFTAPVGSRRVTVAYPALLGEASSLWYDAGPAAGEYKSVFKRTGVYVTGENGQSPVMYHVYTWVLSVPCMGEMTFEVTI